MITNLRIFFNVLNLYTESVESIANNHFSRESRITPTYTRASQLRSKHRAIPPRVPTFLFRSILLHFFFGVPSSTGFVFCLFQLIPSDFAAWAQLSFLEIPLEKTPARLYFLLQCKSFIYYPSPFSLEKSFEKPLMNSSILRENSTNWVKNQDLMGDFHERSSQGLISEFLWVIFWGPCKDFLKTNRLWYSIVLKGTFQNNIFMKKNNEDFSKCSLNVIHRVDVLKKRILLTCFESVKDNPQLNSWVGIHEIATGFSTQRLLQQETVYNSSNR